MKFIGIAATSLNGVIGVNNQIPWKLKTDLNFFKNTTIGEIVIMGRKTFESLKKPLKGRENWILSKTLEPIEGIKIFRSLDEILDECRISSNLKCFVIGGSEIYKLFEEYFDEFILTQVLCEIEGDSFLNLDFLKNNYRLLWIDKYEKNDENEYNFNISHFVKNKL